MEHLTYCDKGVVMLRRLLRRDVRKLAAGEEVAGSPLRTGGLIPTYCHDTVLRIPPIPGIDDLELQAEIGRQVTGIVVEGEHHTADDRLARVREALRAYEAAAFADAAE